MAAHLASLYTSSVAEYKSKTPSAEFWSYLATLDKSLYYRAKMLHRALECYVVYHTHVHRSITRKGGRPKGSKNKENQPRSNPAIYELSLKVQYLKAAGFIL